MGRMNRKGFTLYELVVSVVALIIFVLFVGVCGSLIYWLISSAH
jgi:Tfp pilus assembly protein PilE